jgi:hypothetical protein
MDAVNDQSAWDEATERVAAYYGALDLGGVESRARETLRVIEAARTRCAANPSLHPIEAAMTEARESLTRWAGDMLPGTTLETGLITLKATDALAHWPSVRSEAKPGLPVSPVSAAPDIDFSSMAARDMNFGAIETIAQETWQKFDWGPVLRAAALWTAIFFLSLYVYDRFFAP